MVWNKIDIKLKKLKKDYLSGIRVCTIAKQYNCTIQTIYSRLKKLGLTKTNSESHLGLPAWNKGKGNGRTKYKMLAEKILGRPLKKGEVVHHIDGDRKNNTVNNLIIFASHSEHMKKAHSNKDVMKEKGRRGLIKKYGIAALKVKGIVE